MTTEQLTVPISYMTSTVMGLSMVALILVLVLTYVYIRRSYPQGYSGTFLGMATYFLLTHIIINIVLSVVDWGFSSIKAGEEFATALAHIETIVLLILQTVITIFGLEFSLRKFGYKPGDNTFGNIMAYGYGFALFEGIQWVIQTAVNEWLIAVGISHFGLEFWTEEMTAEESENFIASISYMFDYTPFHYIWVFLERTAHIAFIIALVTMISLVVKQKLNKTFLGTVMGWYFAFYMPNVLKIFGVIKYEFFVMLLELVVTVASILFTWQLMKRLTPEDTYRLNEIRKGGMYEALFSPRGRGRKQTQKSSITKAANSNSNSTPD